VFSSDRLATERAYAQAPAGGAETCGCVFCQNYVAVRERLLPEPFVAFLESVGIDSRKEAEAYHNARIGNGKHHDGGWYHFVGQLHETGDFPMTEAGPGFSYYLCRAQCPHLRALDGHNLVEVGFVAESVPWVIDEDEPD
jgi:hypothetical protein